MGREDLVWKTHKIVIDPDRCLGEGDCVRVCPFMVLEIKKVNGKKISTVVRLDNCFLCQACQSKCPTDAITITW